MLRATSRPGQYPLAHLRASPDVCTPPKPSSTYAPAFEALMATLRAMSKFGHHTAGPVGASPPRWVPP
jgi:hypothetical protein